MTLSLSNAQERWSRDIGRRLATCVVIFLAAGLSDKARGWEFSWVPVDSDGSFTVAGSDDTGEPTEIILNSGPGYIVEFELRLNGWRFAAGSPTLGTAQAGVDATGFLGINADPPNPGFDLTPLNNQAWREHPANGGPYDGALTKTKTCHEVPALIDTGRGCADVQATAWEPCTSGVEVCFDNPEFVFVNILHTGAVATSTANFIWGGVTNAGECRTDEGNSYYLGTLILNVPAGAGGTYSFGFEEKIATTFMNDCSGSALSDEALAKTHGKVTLTRATGKCCYNTRIDPQCIDSVTESDCNAQPAPRFFTLDATCSGAADECALDCDGVAVSAGGQRAGDITADGFVDSSDFLLMRLAGCRFSGPGTPMASPATCDVFDFDCDGDLDVYDFAGFQHAFNPP